MAPETNSYKKGIFDGIPIALGYLTVAFAFGISACEQGLTVIETLLISMTNVTSAGQLAAVPIMTAGGSLFELCGAQLVINMRYSLMSVSLSQKLGKSVHLRDRFLISFVNTDEVFAVASAQNGTVGKKYLYGLILTPYIGWSTGTLLGAAAGKILPSVVVSALSIAIYGMFVAIVVPEAKKSRAVALCALFSAGLSCLFRYTPFLSKIPTGFVIMTCALLASALFALIFPIDTRAKEEN